ncbi:MAG TPA: carbohydrate ABC transporter permease [Thermotogota bacterium]|nr:carbohydrate ABC transporter permease [Thermotogota bacterium]HPJ88487.1 carbohydrate ABC transporter permease [Thermotogota bacterium]HPR96187.1 carbohydrate ABC transporter permease [Thermotogota bacterium]
MTKINKSRKTTVYIVAVLLSLLFIFPFLWMVSTSFKTQDQIFDAPMELLPNPFVTDAYRELFTETDFSRYFLNTIFVTGMTLLGVLTSSSIVAFGFSYFKFPAKEALFKVLLATMMLPAQVTMIPQYMLFDKLGWVGSFKPLIIPTFFGGTWVIFLLRQFFDTVPKEYAEAAKMDGANELKIFFRIYLPLAKAPVATAALFVFLWTWTDFLNPLIYLHDDKMYTLSIALHRIASGTHYPNWPVLMGGSLLMALPIIILFFTSQKTFINGATISGIKG